MAENSKSWYVVAGVLIAAIILGAVITTPDKPKPRAAAVAPRPVAPARTPLGPTRAELAALFDGVTFEERTLNNGETVYSGDGGVTMVEMYGAGDPYKVSVMSGIAKDKPSTAANAIQFAGRLIKAATTEPEACTAAWLEALKALEDSQADVPCRDRTLTLKSTKLGFLITTLSTE